MSPNDSHECIQTEQFTEIQAKLASNDEKLKTIFTVNNKLEETLIKLDETQGQLAIQLSELNSAFKTTKYLFTLSTALFGGIFVFLITELIKII